MIKTPLSTLFVLSALVLHSSPRAAEGARSVNVPLGWTAEGMAQTVLGPVDPTHLGFTQMHEHVFLDFLEPTKRMGYRRSGAIPPSVLRFLQEFERIPAPQTKSQLEIWNTPQLSLSMLPVLRLQELGLISEPYGGYWSKAIVRLDDFETARSELDGYHTLGGQSIVELTSRGLGQQPALLRKLAQNLQVNIVIGTGWYRWPFHPPELQNATVAELTQILVDDVTRGIAGTAVKAGIIGEIPLDATSVAVGPDEPLLSNAELAARKQKQVDRANDPSVAIDVAYDARELKVLRAAAHASRLTGAALTLHVFSTSDSFLNVLEAEGVDLTRVILSHSDQMFVHPDVMKRFLQRGVTLEADYELQYYATVGPVSDDQQLILQGIAAAIKNGYSKQILLSLDLCLKLGLKKYGGGGYSWLLESVLPYLRAAGVSSSDIQQVMVGNPKRLLTFAAPRPAVN